MAKQVLTNAGLWLRDQDLGNSFNSVVIEGDTNLHKATAHQDGGDRFLPGYRGVRVAASGYYEAATEAAIVDEWGLSGVLLTATTSLTEGSIGFAGQMTLGEFKSGASLDDVAGFEFSGQLSDGAFSRGRLLGNRTGASGGGQTAGALIGALGASQTLYGGLHVLACTGTLNVTIESGDNAAMANPTTKLTFAEAEAPGQQWLSAAGANTQTHYRAKWTLTGGAATFIVFSGR